MLENKSFLLKNLIRDAVGWIDRIIRIAFHPKARGITYFSILLLSSSAYAQTSTKFSSSTAFAPTTHSPTVFIPGVMGSRLAVDGQVIWGEFPLSSKDARHLIFDENSSIEATELESVTIHGSTFKAKAYGNHLSLMRSHLTSADWFYAFSYDWRQSNKKSAIQLNEYLCEAFAGTDDEIYLVAHSMGGLVVKHWLIDHFENGCRDIAGEVLPIGGVLFVATPHLGAPDSFSTLLSGDIGLFPLAEGYYLKDIDLVGLTFDSIYELLPAQHAYNEIFDIQDLCVLEGAIPKHSSHTRLRIFHRDSVQQTWPVDVYSATSWKRLGLFERLDKLTTKYNFDVGDPTNYLQTKLDRARTAACELAKFRTPESLDGKLHYLAGRIAKGVVAKPSTIDEVLIADTELWGVIKDDEILDTTDGTKRHVYYNLSAGDETVPLDVALDGNLLGRRGKSGNADHLGILNTTELIETTSLFVQEARLQLEGGGEISVSGEVSQPSLELALLLGKEAVSSKEVEWKGAWNSSVPVSNIVDGTGIKIGSLMHVDQNDSDIKATYATLPQWSTLGDSILISEAMNGNIVSNSQAIDLARFTKSATDWHVVSNLAGLSDQERTDALISAADAYSVAGNATLASKMYQSAMIASVVSGDTNLEPKSPTEASNLYSAIKGAHILNDYVGQATVTLSDGRTVDLSAEISKLPLADFYELQSQIWGSAVNGNKFEIDYRNLNFGSKLAD